MLVGAGVGFRHFLLPATDLCDPNRKFCGRILIIIEGAGEIFLTKKTLTNDRIFGTAVPKPAKRQRIADQIITALITPRPNFINVYPAILCSEEQHGEISLREKSNSSRLSRQPPEVPPWPIHWLGRFVRFIEQKASPLLPITVTSGRFGAGKTGLIFLLRQP